MIYIFEDRFERRKHNRDIESKYPDKVRFAKFDINPLQNLEDFIIDRFSDAECILFHKSYSFLDIDTNINDIRDTFTKLAGARFAVFSGGIERGSISSNGDITVNADVMYDNLEFFLNTYKETGKLIYEILLWGESYNLNRQLSTQISLHIENFLDCDLSETIDSETTEDRFEGIDLNGRDIVDLVNEAMDADTNTISLNTIREIVQSLID